MPIRYRINARHVMDRPRAETFIERAVIPSVESEIAIDVVRCLIDTDRYPNRNVHEIARRACDITAALVEEFMMRDWLQASPTPEELEKIATDYEEKIKNK